MSRVEPNRNPNTHGFEESRQADRGRDSHQPRTDTPNPGHTPTKAEGEERDVEEALRRK